MAMLNTLPNANLLDDYWTLAHLVNRRDYIVTDTVRVKNRRKATGVIQ